MLANPSFLPSGDGANLGCCTLVGAVVLLTGASQAGRGAF